MKTKSIHCVISALCLGLSSGAQTHEAHTSRVEISIEDKPKVASIVVDQFIPGSLLTDSLSNNSIPNVNSEKNELKLIAKEWTLYAGENHCERTSLEFVDTQHQGLYHARVGFTCDGTLDPLRIDFDWLQTAPKGHHVNTKLRLKGKQKWLVVEQHRPSLTIDVNSIQRKWLSKR